MSTWLTILGMVAVTFSVRLSAIMLLGDRLPDRLRCALRYVPPAALSAIIFPELMLPQGTLDLGAGNPRLWAGLLAALIAWQTRSALLAIGAGMLALWLLQALL